MRSVHEPSKRDLPGRPREKRLSVIPVFLFAGIFVLKVYLARIVVLADTSPLRALALEGGIALLLASGPAFVRRGRWWVWLGVDAFVSVVCIAVLVYAFQFEQIPTLATLGQSRELIGVREAVGALVKPAYLLFLADIPVLASLFLAARPRRRPRRRPVVQRDTPRLDARLVVVSAVAILWVAVTFVSLAAAGPIDDSVTGSRVRGLLAYAIASPPSSDAAESEADIAQEVADAASTRPSAAESSLSTPQPSHGSNVALTKIDVRSPSAMQGAFDNLQGGGGGSRMPKAPATGSARGKSVIIVQVESLSTWTMLARIGSRQVTPNLNELARESWFIPKVITQIGPGNTSDAEFTANTSLLADRSTPSSYLYGDKTLPSLPRLARAAGYDAMTFHTNHVSYWRRHLLYPALGFTRWYSKPDFPSTDIIDGIGASDRVLYQKVCAVLEARGKTPEPFLAEVITLAAHSPFIGASERSTLQVSASIRGTSLEDYLRAVNYEDVQLGAFIDRLKEDGLWDRAVVVIYGDHFGVRPVGGTAIPLSRKEKNAIDEMLGRKATWADTYEVPLLIHLPGQKDAQRIDAVRAQVDIMPTIADLLGFGLKRAPHIGASVFDARARMVVMRHYVPNGTFVTDRYVFRPGTGYADAKVSTLDGSTAGDLPLSTVPKVYYERIKTLIALNRLYLKSLPER